MSSQLSEPSLFRKNNLSALSSGSIILPVHLCSSCEAIPENTLDLRNGYDHYQSIAQLKESAGSVNYCHLCQMIWEAVSTSTRFDVEGDPLLLEDWPVRLYAIQADANASWSWRGYSVIEVRSGDRSISTDDTWHTAPTWSAPGIPGAAYPVVTRLHLHEGDDANPITYTNAALDETSPMSVQQRQWWFHTCQTAHKHSTADEQPLLPSRVIDVDPTLPRPKLKLQTEPPSILSSYVALSYCWGQSKNTLTTANNLLLHVSEGFEIKILPRTIQDAITLTQELGIRYLWVDALCILQGTDAAARNDMDAQAARMSSVYGNATVTIIAASSSDCAEGIFRKRRLVRTSKVAHDGFTDRKIWSAHRKMTTDLGLSGQYNTRAWTLQEMSLSSRALFFTYSMQYWKCPHGVIGEDGKQSRFSAVKSMTREHVQQDWHAVVQEYSRRKLTFDQDKFPALSGLAKIYERGRQSSAQYHAGLWSASLTRDLLWRTELSEMPIPAVTTWRAPSWSWASTNEAIDFDIAEGDIGDDEYKAIIDVNIGLDSVDPHGRLKYAKLTVQGKVKDVQQLVINAYHTAGDAVVAGLTARTYIDKKRKWSKAEFITEPCRLLLLTKSRGLLIAKADPAFDHGPNIFRRIGVFMVTPRHRSHNLGGWQNTTVILI